MGATLDPAKRPGQLLADVLEGRLDIREACEWVAGLLSSGPDAVLQDDIKPAAFSRYFLDVVRGDAERLFTKHLHSPPPLADATSGHQEVAASTQHRAAPVTPDFQSSELFPSLPSPAQQRQPTQTASAGKRVAPSPVASLTRDAQFSGPPAKAAAPSSPAWPAVASLQDSRASGVPSAWGKKLPTAALEARLTKSHPSPRPQPESARQHATTMRATPEAVGNDSSMSAGTKPAAQAAPARQTGPRPGPDASAAPTAARPGSTARQPVPGQSFEDGPSSAESSRPPSGSRSSRRKKAQQGKLASAQGNGTATAEVLSCSVLLEGPEPGKPSSGQGKSLLGPAGSAEGQASDDSPSSGFRLHRQPHKWSPIPTENGHGPSHPAAASQPAAGTGLASAPDRSGSQGTQGRTASRTARTLPLTRQQPQAAAATAAAAGKPAQASSWHRAAAGSAASPDASWPKSGAQAGGHRVQEPEQTGPATGTDDARPGEHAETAVREQHAESLAPCQQAPVQQAPGASGDRSPSSQALRTAAQLHACLMSSCASVAVLPELELLVQLINLPLHSKQEPSSPPAASFSKRQPQILGCPAEAAAYGCYTLDCCGDLLESLPDSFFQAVQESSAVAEHAPSLASRAAAFAALRLAQQHKRPAAGQGSFRPSAHLTDPQGMRSQEAQQRITNREKCRDTWMELMRSVSSVRFSSASGGQTPHIAGIYTRLAVEGHALLRSLHLDNYAAFAHMFVAEMLRAAATGEAFLEDSLSTLADRDPSKFQQLNQRMSAQSGGPAAKQAGRPGSRPSASPSSTHTGLKQTSGAAARKAAASRDFAEAAGLAAAELLCAQFQPAQHAFVTFLAAVDSHRLATHIRRCAGGQLQALHLDALQAASRGQAPQLEAAAAASTLGLLLSMLCFALCSGPQLDPDAPGSAVGGALPVDAAASLAEARAHPVLLLPTALWVARTLWFLPWDPGSLPALQPVARQLAGLQAACTAHPGSRGLTPTALALRAVLDALFTRWEEWGLPSSTWNCGDSQQPEAGAGIASEVPAAWHWLRLIDPRWDQLAAGFQTKQAGRQWRPAGVRKITPSATTEPTPQVPAHIQALLQPSTSEQQQQLQTAFLDQYSAAEDKVRLREVVDYLSQTLATSLARRAVQAALAAAEGAASRAAAPPQAGSRQAPPPAALAASPATSAAEPAAAQAQAVASAHGPAVHSPTAPGAALLSPAGSGRPAVAAAEQYSQSLTAPAATAAGHGPAPDQQLANAVQPAAASPQPAENCPEPDKPGAAAAAAADSGSDAETVDPPAGTDGQGKAATAPAATGSDAQPGDSTAAAAAPLEPDHAPSRPPERRTAAAFQESSSDSLGTPSPDLPAGSSAASAPQQTPRPERMHRQSQGTSLLDTALMQAWAAGSAYVADTLPQKALDALEALAPPDWPPAVCATAAAIVAAAAQVMAATALRDEVPAVKWLHPLICGVRVSHST